MRIALLTNYPAADNASWKKELALGLRNKGIELIIVYGKSSLLSHFRTFMFRRKYKAQVQHIQSNTTGSKTLVQTITGFKNSSNYLFFRKYNFKTYTFPDLNSDRAIAQISNLQCDYHISALDQILSKKFVAAIPKILNVHYGKLPEVKGTSAAEWTLLETGELCITLHYINAGIDTGEVIRNYKIDLSAAGSFSTTELIQQQLANIYISFLTEELPAPDTIAYQHQPAPGKLYTYMHREIRKHLLSKYNIN